MRAPITHFGRGCVSGALHLLLMINSLVSPGAAVAATACLVFGFAPAARAADSVRKAYDVPRGDAAETLKRFAEESGKQVVFLVDVVRGVTTNPVIGEFTARDAIDRMVANTGLVVVQDEKTGAIMINRTAPLTQSTRPSRSDAKPQTESVESLKPMKRGNPITLFAGWLTLALAPSHVVSAADGRPAGATSAQTGTLSGWVSNAATGNLLEGARIEIVALGLSTLTDNTGRFVLAAVPAGTHEVAASYTGLDAVRLPIAMAAGQRATRDFDLTTGIYRLEQFKVTGEREGAAAAITAQRNAGNVKNVVAMDSFGNLPNMSSGEVAIRLPGVAGILDGEGNVSDLSVRGMGPGFNSVTVDGGLAANQSGASRLFRMQHFPGAMFEEVELTKGHTPDKEASSLGGTTNFKTRSPLSMKEKRRISYNFGVKTAPSFTEQTPLREAARSHPSFSLAYQEAFSVFSGKRNLGVAVNLFYNENATGYFQTQRDYENTTSTPAYVWDYRTTDASNNRKQTSMNVKFEWRPSPTTKFTLNGVDNIGYEPRVRSYATRAFTTQSVGTTGNAGILPGYTDRVTQVRAMPNSEIRQTTTVIEWFTRLRHWDFGAEHVFGRLQLNYNATYSHVNTNSSHGGDITNRISDIGWILDRTQSDLYPRFLQTAGPDFTNSDNYRPTLLSSIDNQIYNTIKAVRGDARYRLFTRIPVFLKTGFRLNETTNRNANAARRWDYIGTSALPADPSFITSDLLRTGRKIPQWEIDSHLRENRPVMPALWNEDVYYHESTKYTGKRAVTEAITAWYVMADGKLGNSGLLGRTGYLTGVRTEKTETEGSGWVRTRVASTTAQRAADGVAAARRDYENNWSETKGGNTKSFPSAHLTHDITPSVKARLSWSTSFGRPAMSHSTPNETANETNQTLTTNNPSIRPQTAENWDATLDYYFEPVGNFSVGWFHKTIKDYIVGGIIMGTVSTGNDNGYNGEYGGFRLLSTINAGAAVVQGWEMSYRQQFTFLPGLLKGLSLWGNHTWLDTHGDFGGTAIRSTGQVAGFIPRTGNAGLSWRHRSFSSQILLNYTSDYITAYSAASPGLNQYRFKRTIVNVGLAYQLRPAVTLTCDIANIFNEPQALYRGFPDRMSSFSIPGTTITFGVSGRF